MLGCYTEFSLAGSRVTNKIYLPVRASMFSIIFFVMLLKLRLCNTNSINIYLYIYILTLIYIFIFLLHETQAKEHKIMLIRRLSNRLALQKKSFYYLYCWLLILLCRESKKIIQKLQMQKNIDHLELPFQMSKFSSKHFKDWKFNPKKINLKFKV